MNKKHVKCGGSLYLMKAAHDHKVYKCDKCGETFALYAVDRTRGWATEIEDDPIYKGEDREDWNDDGWDYYKGQPK